MSYKDESVTRLSLSVAELIQCKSVIKKFKIFQSSLTLTQSEASHKLLCLRFFFTFEHSLITIYRYTRLLQGVITDCRQLVTQQNEKLPVLAVSC